jgi:hypothetical protein
VLQSAPPVIEAKLGTVRLGLFLSRSLKPQQIGAGSGQAAIRRGGEEEKPRSTVATLLPRIGEPNDRGQMAASKRMC